MNIVFYIAHFIKEMTIDGYNKLREELPDNYKIVWILDVSNYKGETRHYIDNQINKLRNNNIDIFVCDYSTIYKGLTIRYKSVINPQVFAFTNITFEVWRKLVEKKLLSISLKLVFILAFFR